MKIGDVLFIIVGIIIGLMLGSFLLGIALSLIAQEAVVQEIQRLYEHRFILLLCGIALYYCSYIVTRTVIKRTTREEIFIADTGFGKVSVSLIAVRDIVRRVLRRCEQIKKYKLDMYAKARKLIVKISIRQWEGGNIFGKTEEINADLKAKLHKVMGLEENVEVTIKIDKIEPEDHTRGFIRETAPEE